MKLASQITSWVFLPLLTPLYGLAIVLFVASHEVGLAPEYDNLYNLMTVEKWRLLSNFALFGTVIPGGLLLFLHSSGMVSTIEIDDRKERSLPILIMGVSCMTLYFLLITQAPENARIPKYVFSYPLSGGISVAIFFVMTLWRKVSLHAGGAGIMTGFLMAYLYVHEDHAYWILPVAVLVSGMTMSARVYLGKHTMMEVIVGWLTGTFVTFIVNYLY